MKILSSPSFAVMGFETNLGILLDAIPAGARTALLPMDLPGARTFASTFKNIRLVVQYDIQTDTYMARFDVGIEE